MGRAQIAGSRAGREGTQSGGQFSPQGSKTRESFPSLKGPLRIGRKKSCSETMASLWPVIDWDPCPRLVGFVSLPVSHTEKPYLSQLLCSNPCSWAVLSPTAQAALFCPLQNFVGHSLLGSREEYYLPCDQPPAAFFHELSKSHLVQAKRQNNLHGLQQRWGLGECCT